MPIRRDVALIDALAMVAPGTPLRDGLDRILQGSRGALIVVGDGPEVLAICSGGFLLDAEFSPQRLSELAKMDGAIILAADASRIARANVHLVPNPNVPTSETGTRHRTAERVARSIHVPVISVSEDMSVIAVYHGTTKHPLEPPPVSSTGPTRPCRRSSATRTASTRSRARCPPSRSRTWSPCATWSPSCSAPRWCGASPRRSTATSSSWAPTAASSASSWRSCWAGSRTTVAWSSRTTSTPTLSWHLADAMEGLADLTTEDLLDLKSVTAVLHLSGNEAELDAGLQPKGYRLLHKIPRLPEAIVERIVDRFGNLPKILRATVDDLDEVEGVGESRARAIQEGLSRLAESSVLDRYG